MELTIKALFFYAKQAAKENRLAKKNARLEQRMMAEAVNSEQARRSANIDSMRQTTRAQLGNVLAQRGSMVGMPFGLQSSTDATAAAHIVRAAAQRGGA
ncbi:MAG: hypothetical protein ACXAEU_19835 [Candidatus Hodarchaeales archaeon]|jgi:hypothetical protein